jgi:uncharacterized protein YecE (DUF72 family)
VKRTAVDAIELGERMVWTEQRKEGTDGLGTTLTGTVAERLSRRARIGCSGWQYKHWRGRFYPADVVQREWLSYYASQFDTVEINNSFYKLPEASTFAQWRRRVPAGFLYAVKASRFLTHMKRLKAPAGPLNRLFSRARSLGDALGPVLYQLPSHWAVDIDRLHGFLRALPRRRRHAIEFRDPSWYTDRVFALLDRHRVALCLHDMAGSATGRIAVGPFVYVRFHGPSTYRGRYEDAVIAEWGEWLATQRQRGREVYAYFNNDVDAHAPRDAIRLRTAITKAR